MYIETLLVELFGFLEKNEIEKCQLVNFSWDSAVRFDLQKEARYRKLDPRRRFERVYILRRFMGVDKDGNSYEVDHLRWNHVVTQVFFKKDKNILGSDARAIGEGREQGMGAAPDRLDEPPVPLRFVRR
jgi:hypothetical protein